MVHDRREANAREQTQALARALPMLLLRLDAAACIGTSLTAVTDQDGTRVWPIVRLLLDDLEATVLDTWVVVAGLVRPVRSLLEMASRRGDRLQWPLGTGPGYLLVFPGGWQLAGAGGSSWRAAGARSQPLLARHSVEQRLRRVRPAAAWFATHRSISRLAARSGGEPGGCPAPCFPSTHLCR